ncbi:glycosyltransferase family 2 protein [Andreprevotia chitinilytica]|uniref:glycosyltransferase family 2 protein n=1 Tax=Andreprevotia chitinilytica TaxID=396808 RepID=UPI00054E9FA7|nr:glycosyltransferase family 2 protein [Andreprevotia chitinilytica]
MDKAVDKKLLSVVVPAYNEEAVLEIFHTRMSALFDALPNYRCEMIFVNDGSRDRTQDIIERLCDTDPRVAGVNLSRNFGKEIAMTAGFDHARGDAVVIIDADLQDPPELIMDMVREWENGYDVVYAKRTQRDGETWLKKATASAFYKLMKKTSRVSIPQDTGDFRLMSRRSVDALLQLREQHRFMKGLFAWVGFKTKAIEYRRDPRAAGETKFNYWKLWNFALEGITSFTIAPLKIATYLGLFIAAFSFAEICYIVGKKLIYGDVVRGYPSMMVTILFLGGVQLLFIGVLGEYLGRIFNETKGRPLYFAQDVLPSRISNTQCTQEQQ